MGTVKTALSLQEALIERMDRLARELNISRSQLFSRAAAEFLRRHESELLLEAINRACDEPADQDEERIREAMRLKQIRLVEGEW